MPQVAAPQVAALPVAAPQVVAARPRPLRRDAARNRELILRAAGQVFAEQGLDGSVEEIAKRANVGVGTLYRRFPTKDALIEELAREVMGEALAVARAALDPRDGSGLATFLEHMGELQASHRGLLARLWHGPGVADLGRELSSAVGQLLEDAQRAGAVREEVAVTDISLLMWALRGLIEEAGSVAPDAWRRHLDVVLAGLRPCDRPFTHPPLTPDQAERISGRSRLS